MQVWLKDATRKQSELEEIANSLSHGIALVAALIGAPLLILHATRQGDGAYIIGVSVFAATVVLLYLTSTLYHSLPAGRAKHAFRIIEHSAIFLLIAGTYTPFTLGVLNGPFGWTLLALIWSLALVGVVLKAIYRTAHTALFTTLYLLMGWLVVVAIDPMMETIPTTGILWFVAGGLSYTVGVAFFALSAKLLFGHLVWHLFVIAGTFCHYLTVFWYGA